ncbi:methylenetetrahydrofolate reductase [Marinobacter halodurans]|uniref:Methylenetetrahydrofolate reductase n=1 Tax=Marinobacter halodurans TaxID=2528979 RepID=A0ABY1ZKN5_9GAMM|nr:methylenetetrahydrofolate reductase [Marinobacter halodurans]TBW56177.1 methylenetetrahydrofolate reductase [Marinobacter halodurans]
MQLVHEQMTDPSVDNACDEELDSLARSASMELTPRQILGTDDLNRWLAPGTAVYVPFLPKADYDDTVKACSQLRATGLDPVPHFPARAIASQEQGREWLERLGAAGVDKLMLIAGDNDRPAGPFKDTLALLESGLLTRYPFALGVAGHPEGHPSADHPSLMQALQIKRDYAAETRTRMWVTTQFAFEAGSFTDWLHTAGDHLAPLPVYFGIAGPTKLRTLMAYAAQCGVGVSARALMRHPETTRLLRSWTPDGLVEALAQYRVAHPLTLFRGIHLFPFGGLKRTSQWLEDLSNESPDCAASRSSI